MNVVVTGAAGFLGRRLADALLDAQSPLPVARLLLVDAAPPPPPADARVATLALDLAEPGAAERAVAPDCHVLFHLAAVVSGHAEADLELGLRVNLDATRRLADAARRRAPCLRFVFASTVGVYGGEAATDAAPDEREAPAPQSSYGCAKAMAELLLCDYARRGHLDARVVRLPTVSVRGGAANRAVTSFASGVVREPLRGLPCVCPVDAALRLWLCSPAAATRNLLHAGALPAGALGARRVLNLPGVSVAVRDMVAALRGAAGATVAARVRFERDERVERMVASFPPALDDTRALRLGFVKDEDFADIIRKYVSECEVLGLKLDTIVKNE